MHAGAEGRRADRHRRCRGRREDRHRVTQLIELDHVSRTFRVPGGTITAVDQVSLAIREGEAMCIVGESGCGKTTTGRMLAGILRPPSGSLRYEGQDVWRQKGEELSAVPPAG